MLKNATTSHLNKKLDKYQLDLRDKKKKVFRHQQSNNWRRIKFLINILQDKWRGSEPSATDGKTAFKIDLI